MWHVAQDPCYLERFGKHMEPQRDPAKACLALQVIGEDGYPKQGDSVRLQPAQLLELSPAELQLLQHHRTHLEAWGWRFAHTRSSNGSGALVTHAAAVLGTALNSTELQVRRPGILCSCWWRPQCYMTCTSCCENYS